MALMGRDEALMRMQPHLQNLRGAWLAAWDEWLALPPEVRIDLSSSTRAGIVHDKAIKHAIRLLGPEVDLMDLTGGLRVFVFERSIAVRLKKFNNDLFSRNQPTQQVLNYRGQQTLPGLPVSYNLELGYVLDPIQRNVDSVHLVCPNGNKHYWSAELTAQEAKVNVFDLFDSASAEEDVGKTKYVPKSPSDTQKVVPIVRKDGDNDGADN